MAKNGRSFEEVVRAREGCHEKFSFLLAGHPHHNYYLHKLAIYTTGAFDQALAMAEPVKIVVKTKVEEEKVIQKPVSALTQYEGTDEEEEEEDGKTEDVNKEEESKKKSFPNLVGFLPAVAAKPKIYDEDDSLEDKVKEMRNEEREQRRKEDDERRRQEDTTRLRDKLASKAREKMVQAAKEKALQLERKRKATSFLAQLAERKTGVRSVQLYHVSSFETFTAL